MDRLDHIRLAIPQWHRGCTKEAFKSVGNLRLLHSLSLESCFLVGCRWHLAVWEEGWLGRAFVWKVLGGTSPEGGVHCHSGHCSSLELASHPRVPGQTGIAQRGDPRMWSSSVSWKLDLCWLLPQEQLDAGLPISWAAPWGKGRTILFPDRTTCSYYLCFVLNYENFILYCFNQQWNMTLWIGSWYSVCYI